MQANGPSLPRPGVALAACLVAAATFVQPAIAADPPATKPAAKSTAKSKANVMTRDELRACMDETDRLQQSNNALKQDEAALDVQRDEVKALDAELSRKHATVEEAKAANAAALAKAPAPANPPDASKPSDSAKPASPATPATPATPANAAELAALNQAIEALKEVATRRDAAADAYNARLKALRERSAALEAQRKGWVERCTTKGYDEMDEAVILLERKRAAGTKK
jgi:FtsZ-binding cell division protein ZapB